MNKRDVEERKTPTKKADGVLGHITNLLSGGKDTTSKVTLSRSPKGNIGGHEQENHDEEHVQRHMEAIDKEHSVKMASATEKTLLKHVKEAAMIDDQAAKIKATLEAARKKAEQLREHAARERAASGLVNEEQEDENARGRIQARFNRRFASVGESSEDEEEEEKGEGEEAGQEHLDHNSKEGRAEAEKQDIIDGLREAAATGDYATLTELLDEAHISLIHDTDENEWSVLHEAIRGGNLDSVKLLVDLGASLTAKVASGGAALWIAQYYLGEEHTITQYLRDIGAPEETEEF